MTLLLIPARYLAIEGNQEIVAISRRLRRNLGVHVGYIGSVKFRAAIVANDPEGEDWLGPLIWPDAPAGTAIIGSRTPKAIQANNERGFVLFEPGDLLAGPGGPVWVYLIQK
jgi:hypothetical protein